MAQISSQGLTQQSITLSSAQTGQKRKAATPVQTRPLGQVPLPPQVSAASNPQQRMSPGMLQTSHGTVLPGPPSSQVPQMPQMTQGPQGSQGPLHQQVRQGQPVSKQQNMPQVTQQRPTMPQQMQQMQQALPVQVTQPQTQHVQQVQQVQHAQIAQQQKPEHQQTQALNPQMPSVHAQHIQRVPPQLKLPSQPPAHIGIPAPNEMSISAASTAQVGFSADQIAFGDVTKSTGATNQRVSTPNNADIIPLSSNVSSRGTTPRLSNTNAAIKPENVSPATPASTLDPHVLPQPRIPFSSQLRELSHISAAKYFLTALGTVLKLPRSDVDKACRSEIKALDVNSVPTTEWTGAVSPVELRLAFRSLGIVKGMQDSGPSIATPPSENKKEQIVTAPSEDDDKWDYMSLLK